MRFLRELIQDQTISGTHKHHIVSPKHKNDAHYGENNAYINLNHCVVDLKVEFGPAKKQIALLRCNL